MSGALPLVLGVAMTLALAGYRFGESNHAVYLLDALRHNDPTLLAYDWWTQSTLQYHFVFTRLSAWLMRADVIEPAFLGGYIALAIFMHIAWRRITFSLGGNDSIYLTSVVLFQLLAAGTGLGMYQFLQDSCFLPSNIANVAMLWGLSFWISSRITLAGLAFGCAGLFHLNHALAGIGLWFGLFVLARRQAPSPLYAGEPAEETGDKNQRTRVPGFDAPKPHSPTLTPAYRGEGAVASILLLMLCSPAIVPPAKAVLAKTAALPVAQFVSLYVRLRHPHHYDPSSWPAALWAAFVIPLALAALVYRRLDPTPERRRAAHAFVLFCAMLVVALLGAGIWYVSEPLIQMSLYRFSIFPKLLSCIAAAWLVSRSRVSQATLGMLVLCFFIGFTLLIASPMHITGFLEINAFPLWLFSLFAIAALIRPRVHGWGRGVFGALAAVCVVISLAMSWHKLGVVHPGSRGDDASYIALCRWARVHTPPDACFVVPPDEQSFRLQAQRAIVVNFKNVPQLSGELGEWRNRLQKVLGMSDIRQLPRPFYLTLDAIRLHYAQLPTARLLSTARQYHARYVVSVRPLDTRLVGEPLFSTPDAQYFLYDLEQQRERSASE